MQVSHVPGSSSFGVCMIRRSLSIFLAPKSGAKMGGLGFWNEAEVVKTSAALFNNVGST